MDLLCCVFFCVLFQRVKGGDWGRSPQQAAKGTWAFERSEKRTMYLFALLADSRTRRTINKNYSILRAEKKVCSEMQICCNVRFSIKKQAGRKTARLSSVFIFRDKT